MNKESLLKTTSDFADLILRIAWKQSSCLDCENYFAQADGIFNSLFFAIINVQGNVVGRAPLPKPLEGIGKAYKKQQTNCGSVTSSSQLWFR